MTYKEEITSAMDMLAADPRVRFVGYGVRYGGKAMGTLKNVPEAQLVETPVAENLMVGIAIGMALRGLRPVVFIERFDFIMNAMDAIVNHLEKDPNFGPIQNWPAERKERARLQFEPFLQRVMAIAEQLKAA